MSISGRDMLYNALSKIGEYNRQRALQEQEQEGRDIGYAAQIQQGVPAAMGQMMDMSQAREQMANALQQRAMSDESAMARQQAHGTQSYQQAMDELKKRFELSEQGEAGRFGREQAENAIRHAQQKELLEMQLKAGKYAPRQASPPRGPSPQAQADLKAAAIAERRIAETIAEMKKKEDEILEADSFQRGKAYTRQEKEAVDKYVAAKKQTGDELAYQLRRLRDELAKVAPSSAAIIDATTSMNRWSNPGGSSTKQQQGKKTLDNEGI